MDVLAAILAISLAATIATAVTIGVMFLDRREERRVMWLDRREARRSEINDRRADERTRSVVRWIRQTWPTREYPQARPRHPVHAHDPSSVSLPAQARRDRLRNGVPSEDEINGYMRGMLQGLESTGDIPRFTGGEEAT